MGLSGRKTKQRIPNDPRNLAWANDANKFGAAYLAKFGWDPSSGLGASGEGRTKALTVHQKLDMLGIGADHKNSAEGIAWKQNKDFENLLRRLNAANGGGEAEEAPMKIDGFTKGAPMTTVEAEGDIASAVEGRDESGVNEEKRSKKKRKKDADGEEEERKKKKHKGKSSGDHLESEGRSSRKEKKKSRKRDAEAEGASSPLETETSVPSSIPTSRPAAPSRHPRAAFRARHMASKSRASTSASAMAEILGIADSGSATPATLSSVPTPYPPTPFEAGPSTSSSEPSGVATPAEEIKLQELTISSKSVMDYFKEKLAAKSQPSSSYSTPTVDDYAERPRTGLGASKLRTAVTQEVDAEERRGLGGIGSGMRSSFASLFTSATVTRSTEVVTELETKVDEDVEGRRKKSKDKKDKARKKEKEGKTEKGKEKASEENGENPGSTEEKAERKRRKEEKRRRKEGEAQASASATVDDGGNISDLHSKEGRKAKSKAKNRTDR